MTVCLLWSLSVELWLTSMTDVTDMAISNRSSQPMRWHWEEDELVYDSCKRWQQLTHGIVEVCLLLLSNIALPSVCHNSPSMTHLKAAMLLPNKPFCLIDRSPSFNLINLPLLHCFVCLMSSDPWSHWLASLMWQHIWGRERYQTG